MDIDTAITRVKHLITQREAIDAELAALFQGHISKARRHQQCSVCEQEGHTARTCPSKQGAQ